MIGEMFAGAEGYIVAAIGMPYLVFPSFSGLGTTATYLSSLYNPTLYQMPYAASGVPTEFLADLLVSHVITPEPDTYLLLGSMLGLGTFLFVIRKRRTEKASL